MLKVNFDIQKVHVNGSELYYELYYKEGRSFSKVAPWRFFTRACALNYMHMHFLQDN